MKKILFAAVVAAFAMPAMAAEECTEAKAEELSQKLFAMIDADESKASSVERHMDEIEKEYGGEPSEAQVCEALQKLIDRVKADG